MKLTTFGSMIVALFLAVPMRAEDIGTAFTYQGRLVKNGTPVSSMSPHCDFTFELYDAPTLGDQEGDSPQLVTGVVVTNGLFNVDIDFGPGAIDGTGRWLEIAVQCPGDTVPATLTPRQELTPVPHALTVRAPLMLEMDNPGHTIKGTNRSNAFGSSGVLGVSEGSGYTAGIRGECPVDPFCWAGWFEGRVYVDDALTVGGFNAPSQMFTLNGDALLRVAESASLVIGVTDIADGDINLDHQKYPGHAGTISARIQMSGNPDPEINEAEIRFFTRNTGDSMPMERMRILSNGNVGIGTSTPATSLNVVGDRIRLESTDGLREIDLRADGSAVDLQANLSDLHIRSTGGNNRLILQSTGGNVGIGTTSPTQRLSISGGANIDAGDANSGTTTNALLFGAGSGEGIASKRTAGGNQFGIDFYTAFSNRMSLTQGGNLGVGTTAPSQKLHVVGNICATGSIATCSDRKFKTNITPLDHAWERIEKLRGVEFDWNREEYPDHQFARDHQVGMIAQEVKEVLPEVVSQGSDGYYSVDYGRITPIIIEAIKEQGRKIAEQSDIAAEIISVRELVCEKNCRIEELEERNDELELRLSRIETMLNNLSR